MEKWERGPLQGERETEVNKIVIWTSEDPTRTHTINYLKQTYNACNSTYIVLMNFPDLG